MQCVNNLKQLGLSVHNYNDVNGAIPPTTTSGGTYMNSWSMKARLLPFIEQTAAWNALNQSFNYNDTMQYANATIATTVLNVFICPSDAITNPCNTINVPGTGSKVYAPSNYANNIGNSRSFNGGIFDGPAYQLGNAALGGTVTFASVIDGTSNTAMWSEWCRGDGTLRPFPGVIYQASMAFSGSSPYSPAFASSLGQSIVNVSSVCQSSTTLFSVDKGYSYFEDDAGFGGGYCHLNTPNI
jgi:hypothetical protein